MGLQGCTGCDCLHRVCVDTPMHPLFTWGASLSWAQVRYLYVPLGGARRRALVVWPIFFFVALWHDLEVRGLSAYIASRLRPSAPRCGTPAALGMMARRCAHRITAALDPAPCSGAS